MERYSIKVSKLKKVYKLYDKPTSRLKEALSVSKKIYSTDFYALNNINFSVHTGETVGIIGANGSGKSTLLKIITGVLGVTEGQVEVDGRISALLELGAGFNPEYTGIENIYLNGTMNGLSKEEVDKKISDIVNFADIGPFINQPVKTYSSGMFVRLAFAVAINIDPEILIVDEALSVGDVFFQSKCYRKFDEFKKKGKTILFVSHDMGSILKYCDRVLVLNKGELVAQGNPGEMVDIYKKILVNQFGEDDKNEKVLSDKKEESETWKNMLDINPNHIEYGDKRAEIIDFAIIDDKGEVTNNLVKEKEFEIKLRVEFFENINNPIFAFTIKDMKGTELTGTNTVIEKIDTGSLACGDIVEISFKQKMVLQGGLFLLSLGCTGYEGDTLVVYHRLYDITSIHLSSYKNSVGIFDLNSKVVFKKR